ncbi:hypothetical protein ACFLWZ_05050 [Chloroflexota bacterium]
MKLATKIWIILGIGIMIIILISLGVLISREDRENDELSNKSSTDETILLGLIAESTELESQLSKAEEKAGEELIQAEVSLDQARSRFAELVESIEYGEILFQMSDNHLLVLNNIRANDPHVTKIEETTFLSATFSLNLQAEEWDFQTAGDYNVYMRQSVNRILKFVHEMATSDNFAGTKINSVSLALPRSFVEEEEALDEEEDLVEDLVEELVSEPEVTRPSATLNFTIHSYQGE